MTKLQNNLFKPEFLFITPKHPINAILSHSGKFKILREIHMRTLNAVRLIRPCNIRLSGVFRSQAQEKLLIKMSSLIEAKKEIFAHGGNDSSDSGHHVNNEN